MVVAGGTILEIGDFRIRVGDLQQAQPVQRVRGCIVEIEYRGLEKKRASRLNDDSWCHLKASESGINDLDNNDDDDGDTDDEDEEEPPTFPTTSTDTDKGEAEAELPTENDWVAGETIIRDFWSRFEVPGARAAIRVPGLMTEVKTARERGTNRVTTTDAGMVNTGIAGTDLARQYMEILRFNR